MASLKGNNSNTERESTLVKLLMDSKDNEPKYIVRFVQKNLKIGAAEATMQAALVRAFLVRNYFDETGPKKKTKAWSAIIPDYEAKVWCESYIYIMRYSYKNTRKQLKEPFASFQIMSC